MYYYIVYYTIITIFLQDCVLNNYFIFFQHIKINLKFYKHKILYKPSLFFIYTLFIYNFKKIIKNLIYCKLHSRKHSYFLVYSSKFNKNYSALLSLFICCQSPPSKITLCTLPFSDNIHTTFVFHNRYHLPDSHLNCYKKYQSILTFR